MKPRVPAMAILVDRVWPRSLTQRKAAVDDLRKWLATNVTTMPS
jgi:uncharacterized protein YeaO (DUF488 family)